MDWEDDFNHWYDTHHIPVRTEVPGFISAQRYRDAERPTYLAVYEIASDEVLESVDYKKVRAQPNAQTAWMLANVQNYSRYVGNQTSIHRREGLDDSAFDADILYAVFFSVPDERAEEFNSWYVDEHVPLLLKGENWLAVRRFEVIDADPQPWTHLAIHYLASEDAFGTPEHEAARDTEWRKRLSEEAWYQPGRQVYTRFGERFIGVG